MIAVIGTGVVGACVGYYLARDGADVLLVDAGQPGEATTSASFAWVNASSKADHPAYFDLNFAGLREYDQLVAGPLSANWWQPTGHLRWDYGDEQQLLDHVQAVRERGYPVEVWEAARVQRELEPKVPFPSPSALVAVFPSEGWVDGPMMTAELVAAAIEHGAMTAFGSAVRRIVVCDRAVAAIELISGHSYRVTAVVNAAGAAASHVAALVERSLPMQHRPGLAVRVQTRRDCVRHVIHAPGIAVRPDGPGRAFLLDHTVAPALAHEDTDLTFLAERVTCVAARAVPELAGAGVLDARIGHRPVPGDGLPAIGKAGDIDGYYEAVTHSGITLGPILARALTAEILWGQVDPLLAPFSPRRLGAV